MMNQDMQNRDGQCATHTSCCVSWSAILLGTLVAIGLNFLFNLFHVGIGLSVYGDTSAGAGAVAIGGLVGLLVSVIIAMFVAGWVAGYIARPYTRNCRVGVLYGFCVWSLSLILMTGYLSAQMHTVVNSVRLAPVDQTQVVDNRAMANNPRMANVNNQNAVNTVDVSPEAVAQKVGQTALLAFFIFFVAALASCFGGYYGLCGCGSCGCGSASCRCCAPKKDNMSV